MSFYITLPSNSSFDYFPDNKLNNYTTKLHSTLRLEGTYEVGLVEMSYPQHWVYKKDGVITFKIDKKIEMFEVKFQNYDTVHALTREIDKYCKEKTIACSFSFEEDKIKLTIRAAMTLEFSDGLSEELGFKHTAITIALSKDFHNKTYFSSKLVNQIKNISALYVYCNIFDYQIVGNTYTPLLRTILVNENSENYGKYINQIFTKPHYVPVSVNSIDTLEINIRDDTGKPIQFEAGKVLVKLHFQPKNYGKF